jgi:hypothetical protein
VKNFNEREILGEGAAAAARAHAKLGKREKEKLQLFIMRIALLQDAR